MQGLGAGVKTKIDFTEYSVKAPRFHAGDETIMPEILLPDRLDRAST